MSNAKQKHKYYDVIVAWANGEKIQYKHQGNNTWDDFILESDCPWFQNSAYIWRIKPKTVTRRYRMALLGIPTASTGFPKKFITEVKAVDVTDACLDDPIENKIAGFIRWVGETAELEVEV